MDVRTTGLMSAAINNKERKRTFVLSRSSSVFVCATNITSIYGGGGGAAGKSRLIKMIGRP